MARIRGARSQARTVVHKPRMSQLDGLRVLAIAAIVLYHLGVSWLPSGHLGVVMFFVLTGYLVTSTIARRKGDGTPAPSLLGGFWLRRVSRLWAPMALMVLCVTLLCVLFNHVLLTKVRPDVVPALLFFENVSYILRNMSYFDALGAPSPLTHLWYLGVDMQFCLVWPIVLVFILDRDGRAGRPQRIATLVLALVSAIAMAVLYRPDADPSRVYYGPDTRAFSLLVGSWLAMAWPMGEWPEWPLPSPSRLHDVAGAVALALLVAMMALIPAQSPFLYYGGMLVASVLTSVVIAALLVPDGILASLFALGPLAWAGQRSYELYVWHYPLIILMGAQAFTAPAWVKVLAVVVSCAVALGAGWLVGAVGEGKTEEDFNAYIETIYLPRSLYDRMNRINFLYRQGFVQAYGENGELVEDDVALQYLTDNEYMAATHILLMTMDPATFAALDEAAAAEKLQQAQAFTDELRAIEDPEERLARFAELKAEFCEDTGKEAYPDGYVFVPGTMVPEFESAILELEDYQVSDPVKTDYGYHVIMRLPLDPDAVIEYSNDGTPLSARSKAANEAYNQQLQNKFDSLDVEFAEGFEAPNLLDYLG